MVQPQLPRGFTHGAVLRWRRVGGLVLAEVEYEPGQRVHRHVHAHARFVLVLAGALSETVDGRTACFETSTLLFRTAHEPHSYAISEHGATCLIVDVDDDWYGRARQHAPVLARSAQFRRGFVLHLAHRLYGEFRLRDEVSRLAIESIALGILAEASRLAARHADHASPRWLQQAVSLVDQHFAKRLPLATVAALVGVHPVHLARSFRRFHHTTFMSHVRHVRVEFARRQLASTATPLSEIAAAAGFCDQSHFSRLFKRHTGLTPAEYRLVLQAR
jgi:AraC family transcriptional regulator